MRKKVLMRMNAGRRSRSSGRRLRWRAWRIADDAVLMTTATVLSDMDAELAALEAKLAKARDLKQGMMQELLTGRIRLV